MNPAISVWRKLFYLEKWEVGYAEGSAVQIIQQQKLPSINWWSHGNTSDFRADPFFYGEKVIYEHLDRWRGRADIRLASLDGTVEKVIFKQPYHLSYPCIFSHDGNTYLIPEAAESGRLQVLQLNAEGKVKTVSSIDQAIVDPTVFYKDGKFWLAGTDKVLGASRALCFWYADSMHGPWQAHVKNPVKVDAESSRPAGQWFELDGELYRPAQDCSEGYGKAIMINRVQLLDENDFAEQSVFKLEADDTQYPDGLHTLNIHNGKILVDGKRYLFNPFAMFYKLRNILLGISGC
jgi:hypothetical protein